MHVSHSLHILCARACVWFRLNQTKSFSVNKFVFEVEQSSSINGIVTHFFFDTPSENLICHSLLLPVYFVYFIFCLSIFLYMSSVALPMQDKVSNCKTAHFVFLKQNDKLSKRKRKHLNGIDSIQKSLEIVC